MAVVKMNNQKTRWHSGCHGDRSQEKLHSGDGLKFSWRKSKISSGGGVRKSILTWTACKKTEKPECSIFISFVSPEHFVSCIEYSEMTEKQAGRVHFMEGDTKIILGRWCVQIWGFEGVLDILFTFW